MHMIKLGSKVLLPNTGNSAHCSMRDWVRGELDENGHMHMNGQVPAPCT